MNLGVPFQPLTVTDMEPDWGPLEDRVLRGPSGGFLVGKEKKNNRELWGRASGAEDRGAPSGSLAASYKHFAAAGSRLSHCRKGKISASLCTRRKATGTNRTSCQQCMNHVIGSVKVALVRDPLQGE